MRTVTRWAAGLGAAFALVAGAWWLESYRWAGGFRRIEPHFDGACTPVNGVPSPEDLQIDHDTGTAYVSSYDRAAIQRGESRPGAILAYDLRRTAARPVNLTPDAPPDFRPHGISLFEGDGGGKRLFVINHAHDGERIEIFDLAGTALVHARTVRGGALISPNDVVAVGPDRFYVTNSRRHARGALAWVESTFRLSLGNVVYFDGTRFSEAISRIGFPNGINRDREGRRIYVVSSFDQSVNVYSRDPASGRLVGTGRIAVGARLDNVDVAENGDLWVAGRAQYFDSPQPSQVVRIKEGSPGEPRVDEIYVNRGDTLGNASVAALYKRHLLIGSSAGQRFLHCVIAQAASGSSDSTP